MTDDATPSPELFFQTLTAYQKTAALKAALDLNLFTALGETPSTAGGICPEPRPRYPAGNGGVQPGNAREHTGGRRLYLCGAPRDAG